MSQGRISRESVAARSIADRSTPPAYATVAPPGHNPRQSVAARSTANRSTPPAYATVAPPGHNPRQSTASGSTANRSVPPAYATVAPPGHSAAEDKPGNVHGGERSSSNSRSTTRSSSTRPPGNAPQPKSSEGEEEEPAPTHRQHGTYGVQAGRSNSPGPGIKDASSGGAQSDSVEKVEEPPALSHAHRDARDAQYSQSNTSVRTSRGARSEDDGDDDDMGDRRRAAKGPRQSASGGTSSRRGRRPHEESIDYSDYRVNWSDDSFNRQDIRDPDREQRSGRGGDTKEYAYRFGSERDYSPFEETIVMPRVRTLRHWEIDPDEVSFVARVLQVPVRNVWDLAEDGCFQIDVVTGQMWLVEVLCRFPPYVKQWLYDAWEERRRVQNTGIPSCYTSRRYE